MAKSNGKVKKARLETNEERLWHVRLINSKGEYYPHKGMIVKAQTGSDAERIVRQVMGKDARDGMGSDYADEFKGFDPDAQIVEFALAKGLVAEL